MLSKYQQKVYLPFCFRLHVESYLDLTTVRVKRLRHCVYSDTIYNMRHFNDFTTKLTVLNDKIVPEKRRLWTQNNNGWLWIRFNGCRKDI